MKTTTYQQHSCECSDNVHEDGACSRTPYLLVERDGERLQLCRGCNFDTDKLLHDFSDGAFIESDDDDRDDETTQGESSMTTITNRRSLCECRYGIHAHPDKPCRIQPRYLVERPDGTRAQLCQACRLMDHKTLHDFRDGAFIEGHDNDATQRKLDEVTSHRDQLLGQVAGLQATIVELRRVRDELKVSFNEAITEKARLLWRLSNSVSVDEMKAQRDQVEQELSSLKGAIIDIVNDHDII